MEIWLRRVLLTGLTLAPLCLAAAENGNDGLIDPQLPRTETVEDKIDVDDFEFGVFAGVLSIEDFGSSALTGAQLSYHINEDFFTRLTVGQATAGKTSYEELSGAAALLTEDQRRYRFYQLGLGYNLNGETFITRNLTLNSAAYVLLSAGTTQFAGDNRFSVAATVGYRVLVNDFMTLHADMSDYVFSSDVLGASKTVHNMAFSLGLSAFF